MDTINFGDSHDFPYGKLSNDYIHQILISNKSWPSVTHYIYSNVLHPGIGKNIIHNIRRNKDIANTSTTLYWNQYKKDETDALEKGYNAVFSQVPQARDALINAIKINKYKPASMDNLDPTHDILFKSSDPLLGVKIDINGKTTGDNYVGKYLNYLAPLYFKEALENKIKISDDYKLQNINNIRAAYEALVYLILNENNDLSEYIGKTTSQILKLYKGRIPLKNFKLDKDIILQLYMRKELSEEVMGEITHPSTTLAQKILKQNQKYLISNLASGILFKEYIKEFMKNYPKYKNDIMSPVQESIVKARLKRLQKAGKI